MSECIRSSDIPYGWIRRELILDKTYKLGDNGKRVRTIQEWMCLHRLGLSVDGDYGPVTKSAIAEFQTANGLPVSGMTTQATFDELAKPMRMALTPIDPTGKTYNDLIVAYAEQHLKQHPREIGGENRGPWVRLYMNGKEGPEWLWCAGFSCMILQQAADTLGQRMPFKRSVSCDVLATQAKAAGTFISQGKLNNDNPRKQDMPPGSLFLVRRTSNDWVHVGIVLSFEEDRINTIEGNTNDDGNREGYEVCLRARGYSKKDFIRV
ncbi:MAG: peptidoglycan-binding domain-containing protein [Calditrichia bacterium]